MVEMINPKIKNLFFVNGNLSYNGFTIEIGLGVGYESDYEYSWLDFQAYNRDGKHLSGETLEYVIDQIDEYVDSKEGR